MVSNDPEKQASSVAPMPATKTTSSVAMGETNTMLAPFTVWSAMTLGATTTNTAMGVTMVLGTIVSYGGSVLLFWGFIGMTLIAIPIATSLAELASAMPHAGGQYVWVAALSPPSCRRFLSYLTAVLSWAGAVCTGASTCLVGPALLFSLCSLLNPNFVSTQWMGFLAFQATNIITLVLSLFENLLPKFTMSILATTLALALALFIGLLASGGESLSAREVFVTNYNNVSGWPDGLAFFIGINGINWSYSCLDAIVHLAEEIPEPSTNIPKALLLTVAVGFVTGLPLVTAFCFKMTDYATQTTAMDTMYQLLGQSRAAAMGYQIPLFVSAIGAMWGIHVWQSRLAWAISMNKGFPLSKHLSKVLGRPFHTPVWALVGSSCCTGLLGCLYLASTEAFSSLVSAGILLQYISYSIPVALLLYRGRSTLAHGPFWYPRLGLFSNIVLLVWTTVALVIYSFPYTMPVEIASMNYVSVVLVIIVFLIMIIWFVVGRKHFVYPEMEAGSPRAPVL